MFTNRLTVRLVGAALGCALAVGATPSKADTLSEDKLTKKAPRAPFPGSVEFKPLATTLDMVPGPGIAGEGFVNDSVSIFLQGSYLDADLPGARPKDWGVSSDKNAIPVKGYGFGYAAGARWYSSPKTNSWYADAGVGYTQFNATWEYKDQRVKGRLESVLPGVSGGYRWRWENGFLLRLGVGLSSNQVRSSRANAENPAAPDAKEAEEKVKNVSEQATLAGVDLGIGYAF